MKAVKRLFVAVLALTVPSSVFAQEAKPAAAEPAKVEAPAPAPPPVAKPAPKVTITPYGFVLGNAFFNAGAFAAPDYPGQSAAAAGQGTFLMSARQSRFGVSLALDDDNWAGLTFAGKVEFDFKGGHLTANNNTWNAGLMRLRLATVTATKKFDASHSVSLLAGQDYGLVNPLFATSVAWNADPLFWQAGNMWRRNPQARLTYAGAFGMFGVNVAAAIVSPSDTTAANVVLGAGNISRMPDIEARLGLTGKFSPTINAALGVGYHLNTRRYNYYDAVENVGKHQDVSATMLGIDLDVNVPFVNVRGEWFMATGADDTYNGALGDPVRGVDGSKVGMGTTGFWAQLVVKPIDMVWATFGYGQTSATEADLVTVKAADNTRKSNQQISGGLIFNAGKFWQLGVEVCSTTTGYTKGYNPAAGVTATAETVSTSALQTAASVKFNF